MVRLGYKWPIYSYEFDSAEELGSLLSHFNRLVQEGSYDKMNYSYWRTLSAWSKSQTANLYFEYDAETQEVALYRASTHLTPLVFNVGDGSFGEFLHLQHLKYHTADVLNKKEDNENMNLSDCGISYPTKVNGIADAAKIAANATSVEESASSAAKVASAENATIYCDLSVSPSYAHDMGYSNTIASHITNTVNTIEGANYLLEVDEVSELKDRVEKLEKTVKKQNSPCNEKDTNKEDKKMKGFNFDFGPVNGDKVRMSIYGIAVKNNAGTYVSFNPQTQEIIDVDILNFDGKQFLYKMPVAISAIRTGDVVIHSRKPMFVEVVNATDITVVDVFEGERKNIMPTKSPFGFNFMTKVVSIMDMMNGGSTPSAENPFGNILPFLMLNQENGNENGFNPMMLMLMMNQQGTMNNMNMMLPFLMAPQNGQMDPNMMFMMMAMGGGMGTMMNGALTPSNSQPTEN